MATKMKLTDTVASKAVLTGGTKDWIMDTDFPNLGLRLTAGSKSWAVRVTVGGRLLERTIGDWRVYSATKARDLATQIVGELRQGIDRFQKLKDQAAAELHERRQAISVSEALTEYLSRRTLAPRTKSDYEKLLQHELKSIANDPLRDVTRESAEKLHVSISKERGKTRANYALRLLRSLCLTLEMGCEKWSHFPWAKTPPRRTELTPEHGQVIWNAMEKRRVDSGAAYIRALLLTGCRRAELASLTVSQVSVRNRTITLPNTKNGTTHTIYMSDQLMEIVEPLLEDKKPTETVFLGAGDPRKCLAACVKATGVPFSLHSLRKLAAITMNRLGITLATCSACLNHTVSGNITLACYAHASADDMRLAWQQLGDYYTQRTATSLNSRNRSAAA